MNRIRLTVPEHFSFSTEIRIRITDLNYGGHVGNDTFLSLFHEARQLFLLHHGYGELAFEGVGLIMADAVIEYKLPLSQGDLVRIAVTAADFDKLGFDLFYVMEKIDENGSSLAARCKTGMICYDYAAQKKVSIPAAAIARLSKDH